MPSTVTALLHGPDKRGLVAHVSGWIFERGGNIIHADQHRDGEAGIFFQRVEWEPAGAGEGSAAGEAGDLEGEATAFRAFAAGLGMAAVTARSCDRPKVAVMVSKIEHAFHDILLRWQSGELACEIVAVISNHRDLEAATAGYGLPFHHIPVSGEDKPGAEAAQLEVLRAGAVELVVLARYMQVLSAGFLGALGCPVINIHHSFLPAFAGARPYHQAYARGVKLIGATAHYATAVLDDGPIIHQAVDHVSHRHGIQQLVRKGQDLEKSVLAQAVRWHLENRILVYGNKTVVFD